jgi:L-iditol 2-dehydrogenase
MTDTEALAFEDRPIPDPGPDEVVVRITDVGICGSDLHFYTEGHLGDFVVNEPLVLGHESAGEIAAVGEGVDGLAEDDRVAIEPGASCLECERCKRGEYHLCPNVEFMATPGTDGAFVEYVAWPASFVHKLPETVSTPAGALCEPLSVGIHAARQADIEMDDTVLVTGAGPIGMVAMEAARAAGAGDIFISDVVERKLSVAAERGAAGTIDVTRRDLVEGVDELTDGRGVDIVIEASGAPPVYADALDAVRMGGTVTCVGISSDNAIPTDYTKITNKELTVNGSYRYSNTYPEAISLLRRGEADVEGMIDEEYPFSKLGAALAAAQQPETIKTMVTMR